MMDFPISAEAESFIESARVLAEPYEERIASLTEDVERARDCAITLEGELAAAEADNKRLHADLADAQWHFIEALAEYSEVIARNVSLCRWSVVEKAVRHDPGKWWLVRRATSLNSAQSTASQIRAGTYSPFPYEGFDAKATGNNVYLRFVGGAP